jgi:hypothetical protein
MDSFNHKNVQLAYEAIYNQDLCESMEDLGLIGEYDYIDEAMVEGPRKQTMIAKQFSPYTTSRDRATAFNVGVRDEHQRRSTGAVHTQQTNLGGRRFKDAGINDRGFGNRARRRQGLQPLRGDTRPQSESYELYDALLVYLIDEGYAEDVDSAENILENMSDEWIEAVLDEAVNLSPETRRQYHQRNWQPLTPQRKERIKRQMAGAYSADRTAQAQRNPQEADRQWDRGVAMTFQSKMPKRR